MIVFRGRRPERDFTIISNALLRDDRLSFRARGLLSCILSYPEDYAIDSNRLAKGGKEGREAIRTAFRELEAHGYMRRRRWQNERGFWCQGAVVFDEPQAVEAPAEKVGEDDNLGWGQLSQAEDEPKTGFWAPDNRAPVEPESGESSLRKGLLEEDNYNDDDSAGASESADEVLAREAGVEAARRSAAKPKIEFTGTGFLNITDEQMQLWAEGYPAVDVKAALARAVAWLDANPENKKSNYKRFLVNWLAREQDRAPRLAAQANRPPAARRLPPPERIQHTESGVSKI